MPITNGGLQSLRGRAFLFGFAYPALFYRIPENIKKISSQDAFCSMGNIARGFNIGSSG
ncbi:hypothetical protein CHISP_0580 [Chitinispirillum alkaliphilum]|nr:hypothetical protein CHISP_0580 [Chitinispirillum alkaliphilum]